VETVFSQIDQGNIDLNPKFQRRNAWTEQRRNQLIESLFVGFPIPEIVLAENPNKKRSYIVIDGKQRLSTIAGFINPEKFPFWENAKLKLPKKNAIRTDLNDLTFKDIEENTEYCRQFLNASTRCTIVITDYAQNDSILYHIFHRLNTSSVPLSMQELRQVLKRGNFANFLIESTKDKLLLHDVMNIDGPDNRLSDVEILLKLISFVLFGKKYKSNLKKFLDESMGEINSGWVQYRGEIETLTKEINHSIEKLVLIFKSPTYVGRKFTGSKWESRFNRSVFEALVYYFLKFDERLLTENNNQKFVEDYKSLCNNDKVFRSSIEGNTKTVDNYITRYTAIRELINQTYGTNIKGLPVEEKI
jgi:hypothetical protein